jgi:hypothetical protein
MGRMPFTHGLKALAKAGEGGGRRLLVGGDLPPLGARPPRERARAGRVDDAVRPARGVARDAPGCRGGEAAARPARELGLRRRPAQGRSGLLHTRFAVTRCALRHCC